MILVIFLEYPGLLDKFFILTWCTLGVYRVSAVPGEHQVNTKQTPSEYQDELAITSIMEESWENYRGI